MRRAALILAVVVCLTLAGCGNEQVDYEDSYQQGYDDGFNDGYEMGVQDAPSDNEAVDQDEAESLPPQPVAPAKSEYEIRMERIAQLEEQLGIPYILNDYYELDSHFTVSLQRGLEGKEFLFDFENAFYFDIAEYGDETYLTSTESGDLCYLKLSKEQVEDILNDYQDGVIARVRIDKVKPISAELSAEFKVDTDAEYIPTDDIFEYITRYIDDFPICRFIYGECLEIYQVRDE